MNREIQLQIDHFHICMMHHIELHKLTLAHEVASAKICAVEDIIGYTFKGEKRILWEALQITGSGKTVQGDEGNRRIAVVGDKVLDLVLAEEWHERGERRAKWAQTWDVCTNAYLAKVCRHHGLEDLVNFNRNAEQNLSEWMQATIVEAIIGAAYLDGGMPAARKVMTSLGLFGHESDIMATTSLRGAPEDLMVLTADKDLKIWTPCKESD